MNALEAVPIVPGVGNIHGLLVPDDEMPSGVPASPGSAGAQAALFSSLMSSNVQRPDDDPSDED